MPNNRIITIVIALAFALSVTACGQKGPLKLPESSQAEQDQSSHK